MWSFKSRVQKIKSAFDLDVLALSQLEHRSRKEELDMVLETLKSKHEKEVKDAYLQGYGYAQSELFSSIRRNPSAYHKFVDVCANIGTIPSIEEVLATMEVKKDVAVQEHGDKNAGIKEQNNTLDMNMRITNDV